MTPREALGPARLAAIIAPMIEQRIEQHFIDSADLKRALEALIGQAFSKKALVTPLKQLDDAGVKQEAGKVMPKIQVP